MRDRERRDDFDNVEKGLAEAGYRLPSTAELEHRGEQKGAEEQDVFEAGPDMPDPGLKIIEKLAHERDRIPFQLPCLAVGAENCRAGAALLLQPKQAAMQRVEIEKQGVLDGQSPRISRAVDGKPQNFVGAVAVVVDQMLGDPHRAADVIRGDRQVTQCVGGDFGVLRLDLSPGDLAVTVRIEPNGVIEIALGNWPRLPASTRSTRL